ARGATRGRARPAELERLHLRAIVGVPFGEGGAAAAEVDRPARAARRALEAHDAVLVADGPELRVRRGFQDRAREVEARERAERPGRDRACPAEARDAEAVAHDRVGARRAAFLREGRARQAA